jgi:DNA-binding IclR family transcriptional regulator
MKVLKKTFDILEFTATAPRGAGEIASYLEFPRPTCSRLLKFLMEAGYLKKTLDGKKYVPGPMGFQVFNAETDYQALRNISSEPIEKLAKYANGNALISLLEDSYRYIIFMHNASSIIKSIIELRHSDMYLSISGRVHLAHASKPEQDKTIKRLGMPGQAWNNISDQETLQEELLKVKNQQINELILQEKYLTLATPVKLSGITAVTGLVIEAKTSTKKIDSIRKKLIETAQKIQKSATQDIVLP